MRSTRPSANAAWSRSQTDRSFLQRRSAGLRGCVRGALSGLGPGENVGYSLFLMEQLRCPLPHQDTPVVPPSPLRSTSNRELEVLRWGYGGAPMRLRRCCGSATDVSASRAGQSGQGSRPEARLLGRRAVVRRGQRDGTNRLSARPEARSDARFLRPVRALRLPKT